MALAHQPSMWDLAEEASLGPLDGRVTRRELSDGAWVDHLPGWVAGSAAHVKARRHPDRGRAPRPGRPWWS